MKRRSLKFLLLIAICGLVTPQAFAHSTPEQAAAPAVATPAPASNIKSYNEWKKSKIAEIENKIKTLRERISNQGVRHIGSSSKDPNMALSKTEFEGGLSSELQSQLEREMLSLSMSHDLTISDYFVGYLTKQTSLEVAIRDVSARMTPDEVADLMVAFAEHFFQARSVGAKSKLRADSGQ